MKEQSDDIREQEPRRRRGLFFWLGRILLSLILFFLSIVFIVQLPPVQLWGARILSKKVEKVLNTKVTIGGFNLHPVSDLTLRNVFIGSPDHPEDTMLMAKNLQVDFQRLWDFLYQRMTIEQIVLDDALLNIEKLAGDTLTNLDKVMLRLLPERDTSKAPFAFDLEKVSATQLQVNINDHTVGSLVKMVFPRADIALDTLDMAGQYIKADYIDFDEPLIHITRKPADRSPKAAAKKSDKFWSFDVYDFKWTDGRFYLDDQTKPHDTSQVYGMDYAHMFITDLDISLDSFSARGLDITGKKVKMHVLHQNGFELEEIAAENVRVSDQGVRLDDLVLETKDSHIRNDLALRFTGYKDFQSFADSVDIHIPDADIRLQMMDLLYLVPSLGKIQFIADNKDELIVLQGDVDGHVNRLRILDMDASMAGVKLTGDFRSRDLAIKGSQLISLDLNNSTITASAMKDIFPRMNIPPMLNRLGVVHFTGKFDGYPDDFVAFGRFNTGLGVVDMDMNLNIVHGLSRARYSGKISTDNFNVGRFLGNKDIGRVTMEGRVIEGIGLTQGSLNADITATLTSAEFRGYTYRNARLDGQITDSQFLGTMDINDPNVDMHFEGTVDFRGKTPVLDFITRIDSIRFLPLGFGDKPIAVSGVFDIDLNAGRIEDLHGTVFGENVNVQIDGKNYFLDTLEVTALIDSATRERFYNIKSDVASGVFSGFFNPLTLPGIVHQYLHDHYPSSIGPPKKTVAIDTSQRISWDFRIHDSGPWLAVAGIPGLDMRNAYTHGTLDFRTQEATGFIELPEIHYGGFNIYATSIDFHESRGTITGDLEVIAADLNENLFFEDVIVHGTGTDDSVRLRIQTDHVAEVIDELDVEVLADPEDGVWTFSINPIQLDILGGSWKVPAGNRIEIHPKEFNLENFELVSDDRRIVVNDIDNKGIEAFITGFDISYLNTLWINDKFEFSGIYTLDLEIDNIYDIQQLSTTVHIPSLAINNVPYGEWILNGAMNDPEDSVRIDLTMHHGETQLTGTGAFLPPIKSIPKEQQNYLRFDIAATDFPLDFLEFLMGGNIRDTEGSVDLTLSLDGKIDRLNPNGSGRVYNGSTTIDYLGAAYSFHDQAFKITESMIDLTGTRLYDVLGNYATVTGGLTHRHLKDLGLNATIRSDRILGLDVSSVENSSFYGRAIGSVDADFTGTIVNPNMHIKTTTARGTHIYIPLSGAPSTTDQDFVIFLENGQLPVSRTTPYSMSGISLTVEMTVTPDAEVEIIIDDNTGEVLRAQGNGNLTFDMTRTGNLSMRGGFTIDKGEYLFTNFKIVTKTFELEPGSNIIWDGDPYNATLDVTASYQNLTATVYPLIQEYIPRGSADLINAARDRTRVDLTMHLTGSLLKPEISFDISFPELSGEIAAIAESKIKALEANQDALTQQVVGLLWSRSFLPASSGLTTGINLNRGLDNTLSELISASISSYLSGLLGDIVPEGQVISGIDLQVGLQLPLTSGGVIEPGADLGNLSSYNVNIPIEFFNDRLTVNLGGNYVTGTTLTPQGRYLAGDLTFTYALSADRRLTLRAYNRNSVTFEGRKNKVGVGLGYRREADSLGELFRDIFGIRKKKPEVTEQPTGSG